MRLLFVSLFLTVVLQGELSAKPSRLEVLLRQTPWDKKLLKKIIRLDLEYTIALEDKPLGWQETVLEIKNDPDYLPQASALLHRMVEQVLLEDEMVNPPVWLATSKDGREVYLMGTAHRMGFENLSLPAKTKLGQLWDKSSVVMWEGNSYYIQRIARKLSKKGYLELLHEFEQLDYQLMVYGLSRGQKKIVSLEEGLWTTHDLEAKIEDRLDREGVPKSSDPREDKESHELTDNEKEQYLDEIVDNYELANLAMASYIAYDMKKKKFIHQRRWELAQTHITVRDRLKEQYLLDARNRFWVQEIKENCRQGEICLVIGGVDHMTLDHQGMVSSVVTLLREDGFHAELLPPPT